jgi:hypothetical protein
LLKEFEDQACIQRRSVIHFLKTMTLTVISGGGVI